jgi:cellobiose dehydrogenase (acceptor)
MRSGTSWEDGQLQISRQLVLNSSTSHVWKRILTIMARFATFATVASSLFTLANGQDTPNPNCTSLDSSQTYDYIVIGSGAGGIPIADRLSEAGNSVLMIERGPPSSGRWNGTMKPAWLEGTNLTRFDVPGLFNQIWVDPTGVACDDYDVMAGW